LTFNPFILSGYRRNLSVRDCLRSIFSIHNETGNIWTHIIGVILFLLYFFDNYYKYESTLHRTMFYMSVGGCIACYLTSCIYHTFNCHSQHVFETLLYCDFVGIALIIFGVTAATIFFVMRCLPEVRNFYVITCIAFGLILLGTIVVQIYLRRSYFGNLSQYLLLTFGILGVVPLVHFTWVHGLESAEVKASIWTIMVAYICLAFGFVLWKFHIPERWLIGKCDIWFSSHQLWHIFVMLGPALFLFAGHDALIFAKHNPCF